MGIRSDLCAKIVYLCGSDRGCSSETNYRCPAATERVTNNSDPAVGIRKGLWFYGRTRHTFIHSSVTIALRHRLDKDHTKNIKNT